MDVLKFINCVRQRECLYNRKCADYRQRFAVLESWRSVAREMNLGVMDCKEKWHNLRSNYMRERKKNLAPGVKKWHLHDALCFLEPHHCAKKNRARRPSKSDVTHAIHFEPFTSQNVTSSEQFGSTNEFPFSNQNVPDNSTNQNDLATNVSPSPIEIPDNNDDDQTEKNDKINAVSVRDEDDSTYTSTLRDSKPNRKRRMLKNRKWREHSFDYDYLKQVRKLSRHLTQSDEDSDRMFLLSLLPLVKELSPKNNIDFRVEVQQILQKKLKQ